MPQRVADAPGLRFVINLRLSVELAADSGAGFAVFTVYTNGRAGEQITVESIRNERGEVEGRWSTVDLFVGSRGGAFRSGRAEIDVRNFAQLRGSKPGFNRFDVVFERGGKIKLRRALVGAATGIEVTRARPPELKIEPGLPQDPAVRGRPFPVKFKLRNTGTVPAREVSATLISSSPRLLVIEGRDSFSFERLLGEKDISFEVRGKRYGTYGLTLAVAGANAQSPPLRIETPINRVTDEGDGAPLGLIVLSAGLILVVGWGAFKLFAKRKR